MPFFVVAQIAKLKKVFIQKKKPFTTVTLELVNHIKRNRYWILIKLDKTTETSFNRFVQKEPVLPLSARKLCLVI